LPHDGADQDRDKLGGRLTLARGGNVLKSEQFATNKPSRE
jgi:hypothetical protein